MSDDEFQLKLEEDGEDEKKEQEFVVTRSKAIGLVVFAIVLIIFFAVISGVFSARRARNEALEENAKGGKAPGERPVPTDEPKVTAGTEELTSTAAPMNASTNASGPIFNVTVMTPTAEPVKPWENIRLPQNIRPVHYNVYLDPYLELNTFQGNVSILINITEKSDVMSCILIHIKEMNVTHAKVYKRDANATSNATTPGEEIPSRTFEYSENDYFGFELEKDLEVGAEYVLVMSYKSRFSSQLNGLYISTYTNEKGEARWVSLGYDGNYFQESVKVINFLIHYFLCILLAGSELE